MKLKKFLSLCKNDSKYLRIYVDGEMRTYASVRQLCEGFPYLMGLHVESWDLGNANDPGMNVFLSSGQLYVRDAFYVSVWDGGYEVTTPCKINILTREVFDIGVSEVDTDDLGCLDREYILLDEEEYPVDDDEKPDGICFWRE